jgi:thymidylate synthase
MLIERETNSSTTELFSFLYPHINAHLMESGKKVESRNGLTRELLNFKTIIKNPQFLLVGGYNRNINVFFLIAEVLWILNGSDEVDFLTFFNKKMANYSDDNKTFYGAYGKRLFDGDYGDQIKKIISMLDADPTDRRCVASIWNGGDLGMQSRDIPCNDLLMYKLRDDGLHCTIQNRSNDLHWGLPTNVFQFGIIGKLISHCLDVNYATQTHNSQSLHYYIDNPIAKKMKDGQGLGNNLYEICDNTYTFDINFEGTPTEKYDFIKSIVAQIYSLLKEFIALEENIIPQDFVDAKKCNIYESSNFFNFMFYSLLSYVYYAKSKDRYRDDLRADLVRSINKIDHDQNTDFGMLGMAFFLRHMNNTEANRLINELQLNPKILQL